MHFLIIAVLICLLFPAVGRLLGGMFKTIFLIILVLMALAAVRAFVH
jgi:hypothetical protein